MAASITVGKQLRPIFFLAQLALEVYFTLFVVEIGNNFWQFESHYFCALLVFFSVTVTLKRI
jgi:hypothetical protein